MENNTYKLVDVLNFYPIYPDFIYCIFEHINNEMHLELLKKDIQKYINYSKSISSNKKHLKTKQF